VNEVIASGGTAIAVAAEPTLGRVGFWLMSVTGLFATAGATNAGIYPTAGLSVELARNGQFPPLMGRTVGRAPVGMLVMVGATLILAVGYDLSAIASIGSAVALMIFALVTIAHLRIRRETGARLVPLILGLLTSSVTLVVFATTTLAEDRAATIALVVIVLLSVGFDRWWKRSRSRREETTLKAETHP
jgi:L-asparagine transporter-like permease